MQAWLDCFDVFLVFVEIVGLRGVQYIEKAFILILESIAFCNYQSVCVLRSSVTELLIYFFSSEPYSTITTQSAIMAVGRTGIFHHVGTFLLLVATALLLVTTITAPVVNDISIMRVQLSNRTSSSRSAVSFGTFGYCVLNVRSASKYVHFSHFHHELS